MLPMAGVTTMDFFFVSRQCKVVTEESSEVEILTENLQQICILAEGLTLWTQHQTVAALFAMAFNMV